jgi:hypothetical protein
MVEIMYGLAITFMVIGVAGAFDGDWDQLFVGCGLAFIFTTAALLTEATP